MKKVIIPEVPGKEIKEADIHNSTPIFAKRGGKLVGMVVKEEKGWILRLGGDSSSFGHRDTRSACINASLLFNYEFFIED